MQKQPGVFLLASAVALILAACVAMALTGAPVPQAAPKDNPHRVHVVVPGEDRFTPFNMTIHAGELVVWVNQDTDDHTVVSDDNFNSTGPRKIDVVVPGTDSNGGKPGRFAIHFSEPGTFLYHCRFHSHLDSAQQPAAPGPDGGIQDPDGNFGTPMMGVITVLP